MEIEGVCCDTSKLDNCSEKILKRIKEINCSVYNEDSKLIREPKINLNSPQQVLDWFGKNLENYKITSSNKETLAIERVKFLNCNNKKVVDFIDSVSNVRKLTKLNSSYIKIILKSNRTNNLKFQFSCLWNQTGTTTGRLSSTKPNFQSLPRNSTKLTKLNNIDFDDDDNFNNINNNNNNNNGEKNLYTLLNNDNDGDDDEDDDNIDELNSYNNNNNIINIRNSFISREGYSLVALDYNQIELRIMAHYSKDKHLIEYFESGKDVINMMASRLIDGVDPNNVKKEIRDKVKRIVYGILYGIQKNSLHKLLGVSLDEAQEHINNFNLKFEEVSSFIKINSQIKNGKILTIGNRIRRFQDHSSIIPSTSSSSSLSSSPIQAINSIMQGSSADIIKMAMINIMNELLLPLSKLREFIGVNSKGDVVGTPRFVLQVHDELVFEIPDQLLSDESIRLDLLIKYQMERIGNHFNLLVPLVTSLSIGKKYGSLSRVMVDPKNIDLNGKMNNFKSILNSFTDYNLKIK
ncbi:hypothetical protein DDB_G0274421 [Dictyostelium discoideum AX4]|uniref:DNA-directed DNA polymerase family A palm domain-containing protein n=1 Tax=Dictyostelium discoideum TaxID=44689 RepID=Q86HT8_DICDI|nr:hypothetical protein DDB_G0274421 [Dictyostelium discoideum AX4]EAL70103.1 hypothetical protein DDB_G0274421 [Dictyostelium discoideum AX4]|eukprot:XP_644204.1 hypothetical protein DDB_G0274421 [Dictyostelium discoideum AX4]